MPYFLFYSVWSVLAQFDKLVSRSVFFMLNVKAISRWLKRLPCKCPLETLKDTINRKGIDCQFCPLWQEVNFTIIILIILTANSLLFIDITSKNLEWFSRSSLVNLSDEHDPSLSKVKYLRLPSEIQISLSGSLKHPECTALRATWPSLT